MTDRKHTYFKVIYTLKSPLAVGATNSTKTEHDVALNGDGNPIIPATAIAGVYRHLMVDPEKAKELFGYVVVKTAEEETAEKSEEKLNGATHNAPAHKQSRLLFYDAELAKPGYSKFIRDAVKLDSYKTSEPGHKYDFEIIEPKTDTEVRFIAYIEACDEEAAEEIHKLLCCIVSFGAKTTRGYGRVKTEWSAKQFDLDKPEAQADWLEFDLFESFDNEKFSSYAKPCLKGESSQQTCATTIELKLRQKGALSIRQYSTEIKADDQEAYDYQYLALADDTPVIPGTSWAGMFRRNMTNLLDSHFDTKGVLGQAMGWVTEKKASSKSEQSEQALLPDDKPDAAKSKAEAICIVPSYLIHVNGFTKTAVTRY
jgi:CRISPR/Cas system CSM-associated protein Csm3 (group 7 of RAMP superfamily)